MWMISLELCKKVALGREKEERLCSFLFEVLSYWISSGLGWYSLRSVNRKEQGLQRALATKKDYLWTLDQQSCVTEAGYQGI